MAADDAEDDKLACMSMEDIVRASDLLDNEIRVLMIADHLYATGVVLIHIYVTPIKRFLQAVGVLRSISTYALTARPLDKGLVRDDANIKWSVIYGNSFLGCWPLISRYMASIWTQSPKVEMIDSVFKPLDDGKDDGIIRELLLDLYITSQRRKPMQIIIFRDCSGLGYSSSKTA